MYNGYDRKRTTEKLSNVVDCKKASRLYDKLEDILQDFKTSSKSRKRGHDDDDKSDKYYKKTKTSNQRSSREKDDRLSPIREVAAHSSATLPPIIIQQSIPHKNLHSLLHSYLVQNIGPNANLISSAISYPPVTSLTSRQIK